MRSLTDALRDQDTLDMATLRTRMRQRFGWGSTLRTGEIVPVPDIEEPCPGASAGERARLIDHVLAPGLPVRREHAAIQCPDCGQQVPLINGYALEHHRRPAMLEMVKRGDWG
jgi:hypothetical protein